MHELEPLWILMTDDDVFYIIENLNKLIKEVKNTGTIVDVELPEIK